MYNPTINEQQVETAIQESLIDHINKIKKEEKAKYKIWSLIFFDIVSILLIILFILNKNPLYLIASFISFGILITGLVHSIKRIKK